MNRNLIIGLVVIAVLGLGTMAFLNTNTPEETITPTQQESIDPTPTDTEQMTNEGEPTVTDTETNETVTVNLTSEGYSPETITITPGTTVIWTNNSGASATVDSDPHPIHTSYRPLNLERFADGQTHELTFTEPGTYEYHDHLNPSRNGTVIVE